MTVAVTACGVDIGSIVHRAIRAIPGQRYRRKPDVMGDKDDDMDGCMSDYKPKNLYEARGVVTIHAAGR